MGKAKKPNKKLDLIVVSLILVIAAFISVIFNFKPLTVFVLSLFIPSVYLALRVKKNYLKLFWGVVIFGGIVGFVFDFIVTFNRGWLVTRLVFPFKFFGVLPFDNLVAWILMTLFILVFYEHFLDDEKNRRISKNLKWALIPSALILIFSIVMFLLGSIRVSHAYLWGGLVAIIFPIIFALHKTRFLGKLLKMAAYFFFVWLIIELVCLNNHGWIFPGEYIGQVTFFDFKFPFEELFFWMMFYAITVVSYYEFFIDDKK